MTAPIEIDVLIEAEGWSDIEDVDTLCVKAVTAAIKTARPKLAKGAALSILLTDDARIRLLNRQWRQKDMATNVLSFPAVGPEKLSSSPLLGDIAIAFETVAAEAKRDEKTISDHLSHLTIHGFLHILGYDHLDEKEAETMETLEIAILASIGVGNPYANSDLLTAMAEGI